LKKSGGIIGQEGDVLTRGHIFDQMLLLPKFKTICEFCLGRDFQLSQYLSSVRGPGNKGLAVHNDFSTGPFGEWSDTHLEGGTCDQLQVVFALDGDWTLESGPSFVVPGSHHKHRPPAQADWDHIQAEAVALTMPKGSMAVWHGETWHGSLPRTQIGLRVATHLSLTHVRHRPWQYFSKRPEIQEIVARSAEPKVLRSMLGLNLKNLEEDYKEAHNKSGVPNSGTGLGQGKLAVPVK